MALLTYPMKMIKFIMFSIGHLKTQFRHRHDQKQDVVNQQDYEIINPHKVKVHPTTYIGKDAIIHANGDTDIIELHANSQIYRRVELSTWFDHHLTIKSYTSVNDGCKILGEVTIEKYNLFSANIFMSSGNHYADNYPAMLIKDQDALVMNDPVLLKQHSKPIHIEEDCWIGWGAFIKQGVYIGRGAVIGAYSVITKDIDPYSVMAGIPAKELRKRLLFEPPSEIIGSDYHSYPYFYRGFRQKGEERKEVSDDLLAMETEAYVVLKKATSYEVSLYNHSEANVTLLVSSPQSIITKEYQLNSGESVVSYELKELEEAGPDRFDGISLSFFIQNHFVVIKFQTILSPEKITTEPILSIKKISTYDR